MTFSLQRLVAAALAALVASAAACSAEQRSFVNRGAGGEGASTAGPGSGGEGASTPDPGSGGEGASTPEPGGICAGPSDCPAPEDPCQLAACVDGRCGVAQRSPGTEIEANAGDCKRTLCDEDGTPTVVAADEHPDDGNPCTVDACDGTSAVYEPTPYEPCPGGHCNARGKCVSEDEIGECEDDSDCPAAIECLEFVCFEGVCEETPALPGTPCNGGQDQCDDLGECGGDQCVEYSECSGCGAELCVCLYGGCYPVES